MTADLAALAHFAGISAAWTDAFNAPHQVSPQTLRRVLGALGVACETPADIAASVVALQRPSAPPPLVTADAGCEFVLPPGGRGDVEIDLPSGTVRPDLSDAGGSDAGGSDAGGSDAGGRDGAGHTVFTAPSTPGYYPMRIGGAPTVLAVAPARARSVRDLTRKDRAFGSAVQVYSLRRAGDGGIGDFGAVGDAARVLAAQGADALAISPTTITKMPGTMNHFEFSSGLNRKRVRSSAFADGASIRSRPPGRSPTPRAGDWRWRP